MTPGGTGSVRRMDRILVTGLEEMGVHGVLPEEQVRAQPFRVDLELLVDLAPAGASDALDDTVDYGVLIEAVSRIVSAERYQLLEKLRGAHRRGMPRRRTRRRASWWRCASSIHRCAPRPTTSACASSAEMLPSSSACTSGSDRTSATASHTSSLRSTRSRATALVASM